MASDGAHQLLDWQNSELKLMDPGLLSRFPFQEYRRLLDERRTVAGYRESGAKVDRFLAALRAQGGEELLCRYQRYLLCQLACLGLTVPPAAQLPQAIKDQYQAEFRRMLEELSQNPLEWYSWDEDLFCKDIAICCFRMFPAGSLKVELHTGVPRSLLIKVLPNERLSFAALVARLGGFRPYCEIHLDVRQKDRFNPQGWEYSLCLVGQTLQAFPEIKGVTGSSWFFDPQIRTVSPRLVYLRELIEAAGGRFFFSGRSEHTTELAISASSTRRSLYQQGSYLPASYLMIWPRQAALKFAQVEGLAP